MSCRWSFEGSLARNAFLRDSRCTKPYVFPYKVCPRTSMIYLCGATGARRSRVWSDHARIGLGSVSDHSRIILGSFPHCKWDASGAGGWVADEIALWFATLGSFPHCKWDCKWCWLMSCRWSFEGSLARNPVFFQTKCVPERRWSIPLLCDGCETVSCVVGSCSDRSRIILGSVPHCKWGVNCFSCMCGRQNSIVICNCRIVPAL